MAGYSETPLEKKLGIKPGQRIALLGPPTGFAQSLVLPEGVQLMLRLGAGAPLDLAMLFITKQAVLSQQFTEIAARLTPEGALWVAWPKLSARQKHTLDSDMTEDAVRAVALPLGYVDNKVAAIDENWSGLRCVLRVEQR